MGLDRGARLNVLRNDPLENRMEVEVDSYFGSMRHNEARFVGVECYED